MAARKRKTSNESTYSTSNGHMPLTKPPFRYKNGLLHWDDLPDWQRDNHFIRASYRPASSSFRVSFYSLTYLHNESVNIYTHLLPSVTVLILLILIPYFTTLTHLLHYFLPTATTADVQAFKFFFAGFIACLLTSAMYHTCSNHSPDFASFGNKLDYLGIVLLIAGSAVPTIYYGFTPHPYLRIPYWTMMSTIGLACVIVSVFPKFRTPAYRPFRAAMFVAMGLSTVVPVGHGLYIYGLAQLDRQIGLKWLVLQGALYILGAGIYAARVPEKWWPGGFDVLGSSHQIFHVLVVLAGCCHFVGLIRAARYAHGVLV